MQTIKNNPDSLLKDIPAFVKMEPLSTDINRDRPQTVLTDAHAMKGVTEKSGVPFLHQFFYTNIFLHQYFLPIFLLFFTPIFPKNIFLKKAKFLV